MSQNFSRRELFRVGAGALSLPCAVRLFAQHPPTPVLDLPPVPIVPVTHRSTVSLVRGENRRKMVFDALMAIDKDMAPALKRKKSVLIKVNLVNPGIPLACTHPDAIRGILDYLGPRFKGPIVIGEASSRDTMAGFDNIKYNSLASEFKSQKISLVDFNSEGKFALTQTIDTNLHPTPVRIAARLVDPDAFVLNCCRPKTHDAVIFTGGVKNMTMGAPLRSPIKETPTWSDKTKVHVTGTQQHNYNMYLVAQRLAPSWGANVLDGFEAMEGNGPNNGTPVPWKIAIASTDYVAADRIALEAMGMDPKWIGYLQYCGQMGLGNYDASKIDVIGETVASVKKTFKLHEFVDNQLKWMGPLGPAEDPRRAPAAAK